MDEELDIAYRLRALVDKELARTSVMVTLGLLVDAINRIEAQEERIMATAVGDTVKVVKYERPKNAV